MWMNARYAPKLISASVSSSSSIEEQGFFIIDSERWIVAHSGNTKPATESERPFFVVLANVSGIVAVDDQVPRYGEVRIAHVAQGPHRVNAGYRALHRALRVQHDEHQGKGATSLVTTGTAEAFGRKIHEDAKDENGSAGTMMR